MAFNLLKMLGLEAKRPNLPEPKKAEEYISPEELENERLLTEFGKSRMSPDYQVITPEQQAMMFNRIKEQLSPEFDRQLKEQQQSIFSQGITGTPGSAILNKLKQDYMNDLSGRATDIAIQNIGLTEQGKQYGVGVMGNVMNMLLNRSNQNMSIDQNYRNQVLESENTAMNTNAQTAGSLGKLAGDIIAVGAAPFTGGASLALLPAMNVMGGTTGQGTNSSQLYNNLLGLFGGKKKSSGNGADFGSGIGYNINNLFPKMSLAR